MVHGDRANFALLRSWIQECKSAQPRSHPHCNSKSHQNFSEISVIDCFSRKIVPLESGEEYLTLSYVWGDRLQLTNEKTGADIVPFPAPATIEDAMEATKQLEQRYLWVDRYCIKDTEDKHLQIQNMGLVYESALATLVAVEGVNSESGLPGVSFPRPNQPCVKASQSRRE